MLDISPLSLLWTLWCSQIDSRELPQEFRSPSASVQITHLSYSAHSHRHHLSNVCSVYATYILPQLIHHLFSCNLRLFTVKTVHLCWEPTVTCMESCLFCDSCSLGALYWNLLQLGTKAGFLLPSMCLRLTEKWCQREASEFSFCDEDCCVVSKT